MLNRWRLLAIAMLLGICAGCNSGRTSSAAFRLPTNGDPERGKVVFVALGCHECHEVSGVDLPRPTVQPPVPVVLGGTVPSKLSDAYLVTSIIYPSYKIGPYPKAQVTNAGHSRMTNNYDQITVRQLTDVVAFLQAHYFEAKIPESVR
jgi:hypothetical protein